MLPSFYPMDLDYPRGSFFREQAELLKKAGADIDIVFNENRSLSNLSFLRLKRAHFQISITMEQGLRVMRRMNWNVIPTRFSIGMKIWIRQSIKLAEKYVKRFGIPALCHVQCSIPAGFVALYLKEKYGIPYIVTEHSSYMDHGVSDKDINEYKKVFLHAERIIVVSNSFKKVISKKFGIDESTIQVIPNFIDEDFFINLSNLEDCKNIVTVSYHTANKNISLLIKSFSKLHKKYPEYNLIIAGEGPETQKLKQLVKYYHLENKVKFVGFLSKESVKDLFVNSCLFVLPSEFETFGLVLVEAMAMGKPVIATKCGGPEEIIVPGTGLLVEDNIDSLLNGMMLVLDNLTNYDPLYIRKHVLNNYSSYSVSSKYLELYN
jgi:L-malate glycosyltransferase